MASRATTAGMATEGVAAAYDRWAPVYDMVFGKVFTTGRRESIEAAERVGGRVLEVGVGTGISLPQYSRDVVVAQYVVTAVPNPEAALDEFARVVRPGGEIVITTRIGAGKGLRGGIEKTLMPITSKLGWRTEFPWERYEAWALGNGRVELVENRPLPPLGHFSLVRYRKKPG